MFLVLPCILLKYTSQWLFVRQLFMPDILKSDGIPNAYRVRQSLKDIDLKKKTCFVKKNLGQNLYDIPLYILGTDYVTSNNPLGFHDPSYRRLVGISIGQGYKALFIALSIWLIISVGILDETDKYIFRFYVKENDLQPSEYIHCPSYCHSRHLEPLVYV